MKKKILGLLLATCVAVTTVIGTVGSIDVSAEENIFYKDGFYYSRHIWGSEYLSNVYITGYYGEDTDVVIPETLDGYNVTDINYGAFYDCDNITSITIPDCVENIGFYAFMDCDRLTKVVLPEGITGIYEGWFESCDSLKEVIIPETVTIIGDNAFKDCLSLEEIILPQNVTTIGQWAFASTAIKEITIPGSVTTLDYASFYDNYNLSDVTIEEGVVTIGDYAFNKCVSLTEIEIPKSVTTIGNYSFYGCNKLSSIAVLNGNCKIAETKDYATIDKNVIIYAPEDSRVQTFAENNGNIFVNIEEYKAQKNVENFVKRMYTNVLGREADEDGLETWKTGLLDNTYQGVDIAYGFMMSSEFQNKEMTDSEYLDILYNTFFDRAADEAGTTTWLTLLGEGKSKAYVLSGFVNSTEFANLCTSFGIERGTMNDDGTVAKEGVEGFVDRLYSKVMGRSADASGIEMWVGMITSGEMSAEEVAKSFFDSLEYINKGTSNEQFVLTLYETFMGRSADEAGKNMWLEQLNGGMTRTQVLEGFSRSNEFKAILASYGLE